jgi:signal transduction histidine kinase
MIGLPLDTISPAVASMSNVLAATGAAAAIVGEDQTIKFATDEMRKIAGDASTARALERALGFSIGDMRRPSSSQISVRDRKMLASVVPYAGGAVIVVRQIFDQPPQLSDIPKVADVIHSVVNRFIAFAELKSIEIEVSVPGIDDPIPYHQQLADVLGILVDNSLHYVATGGQVIVGVRPMEDKGKPVLLFFVMDNGPLVPEHMRHVIFESGFVWNSKTSERTGNALHKVRDFAAAQGGLAWVDSKTQKACSFFVRLPR